MKSQIKTSLERATNIFVDQKKSYYAKWVFNEPVVVSENYHNKAKKLQSVMYKLIKEFVVNFDAYSHLMQVSDSVKTVIDLFKSKPYQPGTYRTDFVFDKNQNIRIIEITCRFSLNTVFETAAYNAIASECLIKNKWDIKAIDPYTPMLGYLERKCCDADAIYILKGADLLNASRIFKGIFENTGRSVEEIHVDDIDQRLSDLKKGFVISELTLDEITSLPAHVIRALVDCNIINDFRTVLLIHDKRFFHVLNDAELQSNALTAEEKKFFSTCYIPTYSFDHDCEYWRDARNNRNRWILKHRALGKSAEVYAGPTMTDTDWLKLFELENISDFILQEWIPQERIRGTVGDQVYDDFITGTLMFFDNEFFGFGPFRTSSHPVTNVVDDRKAVSVVTNDPIDTIPDKYLIKLL